MLPKQYKNFPNACLKKINNCFVVNNLTNIIFELSVALTGKRDSNFVTVVCSSVADFIKISLLKSKLGYIKHKMKAFDDFENKQQKCME